MNKQISQIIKIIKTFLTICIFILVPCIFVILLTSRSSVLFGIRSYVVLTGSMVPRVPISSMVFTLPQKTYSVGDIITFNRGDITVTHRIYSIKKGVYQTKGDANKAVDPQKVYFADIIGKDIIIIPFIGKITGFIKSVPGFIILVAIPILLFIIFEMLELKKEWQTEAEKKLMKKLEGLKNI